MACKYMLTGNGIKKIIALPDKATNPKVTSIQKTGSLQIGYDLPRTAYGRGFGSKFVHVGKKHTGNKTTIAKSNKGYTRYKMTRMRKKRI